MDHNFKRASWEPSKLFPFMLLGCVSVPASSSGSHDRESPGPFRSGDEHVANTTPEGCTKLEITGSASHVNILSIKIPVRFFLWWSDLSVPYAPNRVGHRHDDLVGCARLSRHHLSHLPTLRGLARCHRRRCQSRGVGSCRPSCLPE